MKTIRRDFNGCIREIDRSAFLERVWLLGIVASATAAVADKFLAIASNQAARQKNLKSSYDYIVIGSGAAGSVVARRLAENPNSHVLLLEAGDVDLKQNVLITENWYFNQGSSMNWSFAAEPSPAVNNRSIQQAMGKVLGGGTSINAMVWAHGHKRFPAVGQRIGPCVLGLSARPRHLQTHRGLARSPRRGTPRYRRTCICAGSGRSQSPSIAFQ